MTFQTFKQRLLILFGVGVLAVGSLRCLAAEKPSSVTIDGEEIKEISRVTLRPDGRVMIIHGISGGQYAVEKIPAEFLTAWGITTDSVASTKQIDFANAVRLGKFREVDGVVYDLRQKQPGWTSFQNVKLIQRLRSGAALVDPAPDVISIVAIHVVNLPDTVSDTDRFSLVAKQIGTYKYENEKHGIRVVTSYDMGRICSRNEIPDALLKDGKLSAELPTGSGTQRNVLSDIPQNDDLLASGSGFFITADGYLITNDHVVRGMHRVKVRVKADVYDAEVIKKDQDADLALLKVNSGAFPSLPITLNKESSLGDEVFTIGFPNVDLQGIEPKYTDGRISSLAGLHDDPSEYQVSVAVQPGNSGGPLLDRSGQVVGIIVARINDFTVLKRSGTIPQNINYAKASALREFLKSEHGISGKLKAVNNTAQKDTAIKDARAATVMVLGYK
jgi:S1-C subfamily serine protease